MVLEEKKIGLQQWEAIFQLFKKIYYTKQQQQKVITKGVDRINFYKEKKTGKRASPVDKNVN